MMMEYFSMIARGSHVFFERRLRKYEIGMSELFTMMYLATADHINQDSIANYFKLDKGTVAKIIAKLDGKGLIHRVQNESNRRENLISITDTGRELVNEMDTMMQEWNEGLLKGFTQEQKVDLSNMIVMVAENVNAMVGK